MVIPAITKPRDTNTHNTNFVPDVLICDCGCTTTKTYIDWFTSIICDLMGNVIKKQLRTEKVSEATGFPMVDEEKARAILRKTPGNAFDFFIGMNQPLGIMADSLPDFCEKIASVDIKSIEFHTSRGDFESWIHFLGDHELERRVRLIRESNLAGEELRQRLYTTIKARNDELL
ncbi:MAG: hypothetical protein QG670_7 [Thermoproteota archaeon]|nr:hypothetical protein [Thermoproteota archaeon]